uniref:Glycogen synthase n=1 Tax=Chlorobium chlorochromatii (strain CaD3) TaxID=340177 RepID=GLGA_CHLCH|nr:RecName: Full=Glycogen synthase; AltName: Full=Starch [bacterial glycogen] synthase [Chlorobium chlorochromatii CaD3]
MSRRNSKVLYVSGEVAPFVRITALADFMASFPQTVEDEGFEARIMMPKYGIINDRKFRLHDVLRLSDIEVHLKDKVDMLDVKVTALPSSKIQTYFLYNEKYFKRHAWFPDLSTGNDARVTVEKIVFFNVGVLETLLRLGWKPDIIHCNDWHTALIPLLLKTMYASHEFFRNVKTLFSIHNAYRQGNFPLKHFQRLLPDEVCAGLHCVKDEVNLLFTGIDHVELLTTTSPRYAECLRGDTPEAFGVGKRLLERELPLHGMVNGLDARQWNPAIDKMIKKRYSTENMNGKVENRKMLLEEMKLPWRDGMPLVGFIATFDDYQGAKLLADSLEKLIAQDIQLVIIGFGDKKCEQRFQEFVVAHPEQVSVQAECSDSFLHLAIAGLDLLLMPSKVESCGMLQMSAMTYGTIPIARATGGIVETIQDHGENLGTGFLFDDYSVEGLSGRLADALRCFHDDECWPALVERAMSSDFSWHNTAEAYGQLYRNLLGK